MPKLRLPARIRAFKIWRILGFLPWSVKKDKSKKGGFYKGAFDSIPFLNDDAKRTFVHLLLRPGYMIRDYINGQHERYLAPLTSLIIFYAFFALVSAIVNPDFSAGRETEKEEVRAIKDSLRLEIARERGRSDTLATPDFQEQFKKKTLRLTEAIAMLSLDRHPEMVDTPAKASLAALESTLRSQGVYLFLGQFIILWLAMWLALKRSKLSISASAAAAAYILCQFCFFMFFSLFLSGGHEGEIGIGLMGLLLTVDYHQLFGTGWKKSFWLAVRTGISYLFTLIILSIFLVGLFYLVASLL